jgi:hypothetical protein
MSPLLLFQKKHTHLLSEVQFSNPLHRPFATLRAANGQLLKAIGRGILKLPYISVVAYIFSDKDLVHNLLGIAPFADRGCEAVFTATEFNLYHGNELVLAGKRYNAHLWHITLPRSERLPQLQNQTRSPPQARHRPFSYTMTHAEMQSMYSLSMRL